MILLIEMSSQGQYQLSFKFKKDVAGYLKTSLALKGEYLEAAVDTIGHLVKTKEGCNILIKDHEVFSRYVLISQLAIDSVKLPYL